MQLALHIQFDAFLITWQRMVYVSASIHALEKNAHFPSTKVPLASSDDDSRRSRRSVVLMSAPDYLHSHALKSSTKYRV